MANQCRRGVLKRPVPDGEHIGVDSFHKCSYISVDRHRYTIVCPGIDTGRKSAQRQTSYGLRRSYTIATDIPFIRPDRKTKFWLVLKNDLKDSVFYLRKEKPVFIRVVILLALFNLVLSSVMVVGIPIMVVNILQMNDLFLGIAQASLGLGGILGGVLGGILSDKLKLRSTYLYLLLCAAAAAIMGLALFPFMLPLVGYIIICAMSIVAMAAATLFTVQLCAAIQRQTPQVLIGKIMAFVMTVSNCASPLGQALYGVLFDVSAAMPYLILFGAGVLAFMISLLSKKTFANLEAQENTVQQEQTEEL